MKYPAWYSAVFLVLMLVCAGMIAAPAFAQMRDLDKPVLIQADSMHYDQSRDMVFARGNVEVMQGERIVLARLLTYDRKKSQVNASGDVSILEPDGNVYFADKVQLKDDLKEGIVENLRARLSDDSLFAASRAIRRNEHQMELQNAVYSPCKVCKDEETQKPTTPLWQIKARKVLHDSEEQRISYEHARFEVKGIPIAYTPYFSHATPDADRKTGVLAPSYGVSSQLGTVIDVPYYINLAPNMDATVTPVYASSESPILKGEYRHMVESGQYNFRGSVTNPVRRDEFGREADGHEIRGHIFGEGRFDITDAWDWGFDLQRASDDTYLQRYEINGADTLTSKAFVQHIGKGRFDRNYALAETISFQGLRETDNPGDTPFVFPRMVYSDAMPLQFMNSEFRLDSELLSLTRDEGADNTRASITGGWHAPLVTQGGHYFTLDANVRSDVYYLSNLETTPFRDEEETTARIIPEAVLGWRYPLVNYTEHGSITIEPQVQAILSPHGGNPSELPNDDSQVYEYSDTSLFSKNKYVGLDKVEEGPRANYGMRASWQALGGTTVGGLIGQTYHSENDTDRLYGLRTTDNLSDYVGRFDVQHENLYAAYRFRLDKDAMEIRRNEVNTSLNLDTLRFRADYVSLNNDVNLSDREELYASAEWDVMDNWTLTALGRRDLGDDGGWINTSLGLQYQNECITLLTSVGRRYTRDRDIEPSTSYLVQILLKNLN